MFNGLRLLQAPRARRFEGEAEPRRRLDQLISKCGDLIRGRDELRHVGRTRDRNLARSDCGIAAHEVARVIPLPARAPRLAESAQRGRNLEQDDGPRSKVGPDAGKLCRPRMPGIQAGVWPRRRPELRRLLRAQQVDPLQEAWVERRGSRFASTRANEPKRDYRSRDDGKRDRYDKRPVRQPPEARRSHTRTLATWRHPTRRRQGCDRRTRLAGPDTGILCDGLDPAGEVQSLRPPIGGRGICSSNRARDHADRAERPAVAAIRGSASPFTFRGR